MPRPSWALVVSVAAAALLAASCSASPSPSAANHPATTSASPPTSAPATVPHKSTAAKKKVKSIPGVFGNGSSITGDSGGVNTAGGVVNMEAPTTVPGSPATTPQFRITKTGRVLHRHLVPVISKFRPLSSGVGTIVIIVGKRLSHATAVAFDGIPATITLNTSTRIKAVVPAGATSGPISVVTTAGSATVQGFVIV